MWLLLDAETQKAEPSESEGEKRRPWCQEFSSRLEASASILGIATRVCNGVEASNEKPSGLLWKKTETELFNKERQELNTREGLSV